MSSPTLAPWTPTCPVCGTTLHPDAPPVAGCPVCGLPAAGRAGVVVARIGATLRDLDRDRDDLLATLRSAAAAGPRPPAPPAAPSWVPPTPLPPPSVPAVPAAAAAPPRDRRRTSPQEVLLGLGALLVVAAALALVAVAWTRFGLLFQAGVMATATAAAVTASARAARRGLRATGEALAVTGAALLAIDLWAVRAFGLFGAGGVDGRLWTAWSAAVLALAAAALARATPSTVGWPVVALLAAQPVAVLLLPPAAVAGPAGAAALLAVAGADALVAGRVAGRLPAGGRVVRRLAGALAGVAGGAGTVLALAVAWSGAPARSWVATALLVGTAALLLVDLAHRARAGRPRSWARRVPAPAAWPGALPALGVAGSLQSLDAVAAPLAAGAGLLLCTGAVLAWQDRLLREVLGSAGAVLSAAGALQLLGTARPEALAAVALAGTVPAALAAWRVPALRSAGTAAALLAPGAALLSARAGGVLPASSTGLLLAVLGALALGLATVRAGRPEERAAALVAPVLGLAAALTGASTGAWGQVGLQLAVVGAAGLGYAVVSRRTLVGAVALGDLVLAGWTALAGAAVETVEAYTLPLAVALLLAAAPRLRTGSSWATWGPALLVGLLPSVWAALAGGGTARPLLVVVAGTAAAVLGAVTHRQAPFVVGAGALAVVGVAELAPYAARVDSWVTLGVAGLVLLGVGASYERRRVQAREAVAWVAQMR